ncbi:MAG: GNAT family N-acetyltransferase [Lachnospiraceae bacterium]|nr:GNAT family N-acetyltransferase [Lachnospiraceae bacterium]
MVYEITDMDNVSSLFDKWEETLIWSCLQGIMGKIYADNLSTPTAAMAIIGDFTFFAGKPNIELVSYKPDRCTQSFMIMVPQNEFWKNAILNFYGKRATVISRYAIKKEPHIFDKEMLEKAVASLPEQYTLSMIDERLYQMCKAEAWSADLVSQFPNYENYSKLGIGAVICKENIILSGASSYSRYKEGIEIEIDTRQEYRRKGFAYVCGAKLILECLKRNLYPSWDAHNKGSVALAEKLGYHYSHPYTAIEIYDY